MDNPIPQIHCDHECVCWWYYEHKKSGTASPCESEKCHHRFQFKQTIPLPNSADLLLIAHDEWKRREERKHQHDHISWVNGWISGFLTSREFVRDMLIKLHSPRHGGES